jgi:hypothetical protein
MFFSIKTNTITAKINSNTVMLKAMGDFFMNIPPLHLNYYGIFIL